MGKVLLIDEGSGAVKDLVDVYAVIQTNCNLEQLVNKLADLYSIEGLS